MSRAFTRRQVLAAAAGAMLGFGACQKQETASDKPELYFIKLFSDDVS